MNWLISALQKEATRRRFAPDDLVRYFTDSRKGTGKGVVLTPMFTRGRVVDYDQNVRQYRVWNDKENREIMVHPRNLVPETVNRSMTTTTQEDIQPQEQQPQQQNELVTV